MIDGLTVAGQCVVAALVIAATGHQCARQAGVATSVVAEASRACDRFGEGAKPGKVVLVGGER